MAKLENNLNVQFQLYLSAIVTRIQVKKPPINKWFATANIYSNTQVSAGQVRLTDLDYAWLRLGGIWLQNPVWVQICSKCAYLGAQAERTAATYGESSKH